MLPGVRLSSPTSSMDIYLVEITSIGLDRRKRDKPAIPRFMAYPTRTSRIRARRTTPFRQIDGPVGSCDHRPVDEAPIRQHHPLPNRGSARSTTGSPPRRRSAGPVGRGAACTAATSGTSGSAATRSSNAAAEALSGVCATRTSVASMPASSSRSTPGRPSPSGRRWRRLFRRSRESPDQRDQNGQNGQNGQHRRHRVLQAG